MVLTWTQTPNTFLGVDPTTDFLQCSEAVLANLSENERSRIGFPLWHGSGSCTGLCICVLVPNKRTRVQKNVQRTQNCPEYKNMPLSSASLYSFAIFSLTENSLLLELFIKNNYEY